MRAWDSDPDVRKAATFHDFLVGDFEDVLTEMGGRVLLCDVEENDWCSWPVDGRATAIPTPERWVRDAEHAVCLIHGCDYTDIDVRSPIFLRDDPWPYHACTPHWEAIIAILGHQASGDAQTVTFGGET